MVISDVGGDGTVGLAFEPENDIIDLVGIPIGAAPVIGTEQTYIIDNTFPTLLFGNQTHPVNNSTQEVGLTQIILEFTEDMLSDNSANAVNLPDNYLLVEVGGNKTFDTLACGGNFGGLKHDVILIKVNSIAFENNNDEGPYLATLTINGNVPLPVGVYRLFACGTSSISDLAGNLLNNGYDSILNFRVFARSLPATEFTPVKILPATGFAPGKSTLLPVQPAIQTFAATDMILEIPALNQKLTILGVPQTASSWDVTWLGRSVGGCMAQPSRLGRGTQF